MKKLLCVALLCISVFAQAEEKVLNIYNWGEYMPEGTLEQFTKETGIKINYATYNNNETMYTKLKTLKNQGYDIVVPSNYFVSRMVREGMLTKLDKAKLPNIRNLDPKLLDKPFDPHNEYSVPYTWGTTGIAVDAREILPGSVTKWTDLWDPKYKNSILLLEDMREVMGIGMKVLGYKVDDTDEEHVKQAYEKLVELLPNVKMFYADSPKVKFIEGEVKLGMLWNGEAQMAKAEKDSIVYIYPLEGPTLWIDNMAIPSGAKHVENAHLFINFTMRPEIAKKLSEELGYATPNLEAFKLLPKEISGNRTIFPTAEDLKDAQLQPDLGNALSVYEKYWQQLKIAK